VFLVLGKSDFELSSRLTCYMFRLLTCSSSVSNAPVGVFEYISYFDD